jgi:hypothetical protein
LGEVVLVGLVPIEERDDATISDEDVPPVEVTVDDRARLAGGRECLVPTGEVDVVEIAGEWNTRAAFDDGGT